MKVSPDIWMPFYIGDYLSDTMHLSLEEHGAYMLTIMHYWKNKGAIPKSHLKNLLKCSDVTLHVTLTFFTEKDGLLYHDRIEAELKKASENKEKNRSRTQKATQIRLQNNQKNNVTSNVTSNVTFTPSPSPSSIDKISYQDDFRKDNFDIDLFLDDDDRGIENIHAPGWDKHLLRTNFNNWIKAPTQKIPTKPVNAYLTWLQKTKKGQPPR